MTARAPQQSPGGTVLPFVRCPECRRVSRILNQETDFGFRVHARCAACHREREIELDRELLREADRRLRAFGIAAIIIGGFLLLMAFCNVARVFL